MSNEWFGHAWTWLGQKLGSLLQDGVDMAMTEAKSQASARLRNLVAQVAMLDHGWWVAFVVAIAASLALTYLFHRVAHYCFAWFMFMATIALGVATFVGATFVAHDIVCSTWPGFCARNVTEWAVAPSSQQLLPTPDTPILTFRLKEIVRRPAAAAEVDDDSDNPEPPMY